VRDRLQVPADIDQAAAQELALASPRVQSYTTGKAVRQTIYVPGRLVNVVVG
jgi:leucyl-tRNA synthetase